MGAIGPHLPEWLRLAVVSVPPLCAVGLAVLGLAAEREAVQGSVQPYDWEREGL